LPEVGNFSSSNSKNSELSI
jgi:hypothetical protein